MLEERTGVARDYLALEAPRPSVAGVVKRRYQRIGLGLVVTDAFCAGVALLLADGPRASIGSQSLTGRLLVLAAPLLWVALFHAFSLYGPQRLAAAEEFRRIIGATSLGVVLLALVGYWSQHSLWSLGVGLSWLVALFLELLTRRAWRWYQHRLKVDGRLALRTLVVGTNRDATHLAATLRQPGSGFNPIGYVRARGQPASTPQGPYGVLGELRQVRSLIRDQVADCLFITSTSVSAEEVSEVAQVARQEGVEVRLSAGIASTLTSRLALQQIGPVIALSVKPVRLAGAQAAGKRAFDLVAASLGPAGHAAAVDRGRRGHPPDLPGGCPLPPGAGHQGGTAFPDAQIPHHAGAAPRRGAHGRQQPVLQARRRSQGDHRREVSPQVQP
jgi:hypothetical protein